MSAVSRVSGAHRLSQPRGRLDLVEDLDAAVLAEFMTRRLHCRDLFGREENHVEPLDAGLLRRRLDVLTPVWYPMYSSSFSDTSGWRM